MSGILNIATQAVYNAANIIQQDIKHLSRLDSHHIKAKAENAIISTINNSFKHNMMTESDFIDNSTHVTWMIDAINGISNYMHQYPRYSISIAIKHNDDITAAVIFDPNLSNLYTAELGKGSRVNNTRLRVSKTSQVSESLLLTDIDSYVVDSSIKPKNIRIASAPALDLASVASGVADGYWQNKIKWLEVVAGYLLVKESGGLLNNTQGEQDFDNSIVATTPKITFDLLKIIKNNIK